MGLAHLHKHSEFSSIDGTGNANQYTKQGYKFEQEFMAITDHGRLGGVLDHVYVCQNPDKFDDPDDPTKKRGKDEKLIPLLGMEAYWRDNRFQEQKSYSSANHLTLIAGSLRGWRTLMRLSSKGWIPIDRKGGFKGKPCIDWEMLEADHEDLIVCSGCFASPLSQLILAGDQSGADEYCSRMQNLLGDRFWGEIMPHDLDEQRSINEGVINLSQEHGFGVVATGDVHIPYQEWEDTALVLKMVSTKQTLSKRAKKQEAGEDVYGERIDTIYLSPEDEFREQFAEYHEDIDEDIVDEAIANTEVLARSVKHFVISNATKLPKVAKTSLDAERIVKRWCKESQYPTGKPKNWQEYRDRYNYEFKVLRDKGVLDYFILVGDMVRWAKSRDALPGSDKRKRPIRVGLGRGSAAGCLISYLIGITAIDPIAWGLLFERFLNPDRVGMPDIDLDFETDLNDFETLDGKMVDGREMVKEYLKAKYGDDHVADIIAYQTFAPRVTIKEVAATQDLPYGFIKKVTDSIGDTERDLEKIAAENGLVRKLKTEHPYVWEQCLRLEDQILRDTRHAGGVLITPRPTNEYMPTQIGNDEITTVTAWADRADFQIISDYGFVKIDVLGVKGLAKQQLCVDLIADHYGDIVEPNDLPALRDPYNADQKALDAFTQGLTLGVFQFSGRGITNLLRHIKPDSTIDIAVANALYRPGPIKIAFEYGDRKNGKIPEADWYWHDAVEPILKETCGLIAFQEQVMEITKVIGNFTGGQADSMRKAISKLYRLPGDQARAFMQGFKDQWLEGCESNGLDETAAGVIWDAILEFAGYGFNKSHSASYALQAYQDMWLKVNYPLAFYAATLTIERKAKAEEDAEWKRGIFREAELFDVKIDPPDVNASERGFIIDGDRLRYGLVSVKGLGGLTVDQVKEVRPVSSFDDFARRTPSNFGADNAAALVKAGAFDSLGEDREALLAKTRRWAKNKYNVVMACGCKKMRTGEPEEWKKPAICEKHDSTEIKEMIEVDPYYTYAEHIKFHYMKDKEPPEQELIEPSQNEILEMEKEVLGNVVSRETVVHRYQEFIEDRIFSTAEIEDLPHKPEDHKPWCDCDECEAANIVVGGEILAVKPIVTKKQKKEMAFVDLAFGADQYAITIFPKAWAENKHKIKDASVILVAGFKDNRNQIVAQHIDDVETIAVGEQRRKTKASLKKTTRKKAGTNPWLKAA